MRADPRLKQKHATARRKQRQQQAYARFREENSPQARSLGNLPFDHLPQHTKRFIVEKYK